jgi:hypothetical protein
MVGRAGRLSPYDSVFKSLTVFLDPRNNCIINVFLSSRLPRIEREAEEKLLSLIEMLGIGKVF